MNRACGPKPHLGGSGPRPIVVGGELSLDLGGASPRQNLKQGNGGDDSGGQQDHAKHAK